MKRKIVIISACLLPFLAWGILFVLDVIRFGEKPPLIIVKTNSYSYKDGNVIQYCSLGYEFIYHNKVFNKGWNFNFGCSNIEQEKETILTFVYEGNIYEECQDDYLYETEDKIYYLRCADVDFLYVLLDNEKVLVQQALEDGKITIRDVSNGGYSLLLEQKQN